MLNDFMDLVHKNAVDHGWWDSDRNDGELFMLMVTEISEAMEEHRNGRHPSEIYFNEGSAKPEGISVELADCIIRILDYCGSHGIDIDHVLQIKHQYNVTRPYRHGGKIA